MNYQYRREEIHTDDLEAALNTMGANGWHLVHLKDVIVNSRGTTPYYFDCVLERPLEEEIGTLLEEEFNQPKHPM